MKDKNFRIIRLFDIFISTIGLIILTPLMILIFLIGYLDTGFPLFKQKRVGYCEKPFTLLKFRTMKLHTPSIPSHLNQSSYITKFGKFLRKSKLDEIPQLINVLKGEMSLVGPRPGLLNQIELIELRRFYKVYNVKPGITGLSQINSINMSNPKLLAKTDANMIENFSLCRYFEYIFLTITGKGLGDQINRTD